MRSVLQNLLKEAFEDEFKKQEQNLVKNQQFEKWSEWVKEKCGIHAEQSERKVNKKNFKKLYGPFWWMVFNCVKARATSRWQFTFYQ